MSLQPGSSLGRYLVTASLGAGGMGVVWRAVDSSLGREVALKVLPEEIADDSERHARFEREAKLLASLNHANIATLYGIEHLEDTEHKGPASHVLVMELVEGEGLDERIARGPMSQDEAIAIALQVASGLAVAHERGIVHRDLKPANVRIRSDGTVKVLDFGLAKAWQDDPDGTDLAHTPTITARHSFAGAMVGTAAYMAPEQARGRAVDHRADIWSFGCLLFEMLTGRQAYTGDTISDTVAAILKDQPRWDLLPPGLDPAVRRVLRRCLAKDPDRRYHHLADVRLELLELTDADAPRTTEPRRRARRGRLVWVLSVLTSMVVAAVGAWVLLRGPATPLPTYRTLTFRNGCVSSARFAPDGETVVFGMATREHPLALYSTRANSIESRRLDLPEADVLGIARDGRMAILLGRHREGSWVSVGTLAEADVAGGAPRSLLERTNDGAISPDGRAIAAVHEVGSVQRLDYPLGNALFETHGWISHVSISPDGRRVAFLHHPFYGDDRGLPMLAEPDGTVRKLAPATSSSLQGLAWSPDGTEVWYSEYVFGLGGVLWSVKPGHQPVALLHSPVSVRIQDVADDGRVLLVASDTRAEIVGRLGGQERERRYEGWNDDSIGGISADGTLFAGNEQQSNEEGEYTAFVRAADGSAPVRLGLGEVIGMSPDGAWVFTHRLTSERTRLTLFPTGPARPRTIDLGGVTPAGIGMPALTCSLDGRWAAFTGFTHTTEPQVYLLDLATDTLRAVGPPGSQAPILAPDGTRLVARTADGVVAVYPVKGGPAAPVPGLLPREVPLQWSRDGRWLLVWDQVFPAKIYRVRVSDGQRERAVTIMPADPAGVLYGQILLSPGAEHYVYRYRRDLNTLYLVEDLR